MKISESHSFEETASFRDLVHHFHQTQDQCLAVLDGKKLSGVFSRNDLVYQFTNFFITEDGGEAKKLMISNPMALNESDSILNALNIMARLEISSIPVNNESGEFLNVIDCDQFFDWLIEERDISFYQGDDLLQWTHFDEHIMEIDFNELVFGQLDFEVFKTQCNGLIRTDAFAVDESLSLKDLIKKCKKNRQPQCVITKNETMVQGVFSARELINYLIQTDFKPDPRIPVKEIMNLDFIAVMYKHTLAHAIGLIKKTRNERVLIMDEDDFPMAIVRVFDVLKYLTDRLLDERRLKQQIKRDAA